MLGFYSEDFNAERVHPLEPEPSKRKKCREAHRAYTQLAPPPTQYDTCVLVHLALKLWVLNIHIRIHA